MIFFDPTSKNFSQNPYPLYKELRDNDPFHITPVGSLVLSRYDHVAEVFKHPNIGIVPVASGFRKKNELIQQRGGGSLSQLVDVAKKVLTFLNPPEHTFWRDIATEAFRQFSMPELKQMVEDVVREQLDHVRGLDEFDFIDCIAARIPFRVIGRMVGIPDADMEQLFEPSRVSVRILDTMLSLEYLQMVNDAMVSMCNYMEKLLTSKNYPEHSILAKLVSLKDERNLTNDDIIAITLMLFLTGEETTALGQGNIAHLYATQPAFREVLAQDPMRSVSLTQEALRYDGPVQITGRTVMEPFVLDGKQLDKGQFIVLCIAGANRDERKFHDPDSFLLDRNPRGMIAFGEGIHRCIGNGLAILEIQTLLRMMGERKMNLQLADKKPERADYRIFRGYRTLYVQQA